MLRVIALLWMPPGGTFATQWVNFWTYADTDGHIGTHRGVDNFREMEGSSCDRGTLASIPGIGKSASEVKCWLNLFVFFFLAFCLLAPVLFVCLFARYFFVLSSFVDCSHLKMYQGACLLKAPCIYIYGCFVVVCDYKYDVQVPFRVVLPCLTSRPWLLLLFCA